MARQYPDALPAGYALQEYTIRRVLGQGGFGITYLAYDEGLAKEVAIKEYFPVEFASRHGDDSVSPRSDADHDDYEWGLTRFQEEARTLVLFRHPAIVPVYRRFEENGTAYMVMEYQLGESLSELMKRHLDDFTEPDLMNITRPVLDGLAEVHKAGYLHRDLKPGNIYVRRDGSPVLLDFGAARAAVGHKSRSLTSIVTPGYAPLEQYFAEGNQGPWTDIYAFAAMLYQCVTGKLPPEAPARVRKDTMVPAADAGAGRFSEPFLKAIDAGLAIDEEDRPQSVTTWLMMLEGDELVGAGRAPDETVAIAPARDAEAKAAPAAAPGAAAGPAADPAPAASPAARPPVADDRRQEPSFRAPRPDVTPAAAAAAGGSRTGRAGRIAIFATVGVLLAGAGAAGGWLAVGGPGGSDTRTVDGTGTGNSTDPTGNGGGGGAGGGGTDASLSPEEKRKRALEEARRKEEERRKAEAERKRQAEEERKRKAEEERKRQAEAERKRKAEEARRRAEAERKRRQEAERRRQAEAERKRQAEAERKRREEEARKRKEREEAERRRQEAEAERKRKQREEAERKRKERELAARNQVNCAFLLQPIRSIGTTKRDCDLIAVTYTRALTNGYPGVTRGWRNRQSGARGTITILRSLKRADGRFCRVFQQTVIRGGVYRRSNGTACLFGNQWRIVG